MTALATTVRYRPLTRLEPAVFADTAVAMVAATTSGVVVEVNDEAAELLGRQPYELVQEPLARFVTPASGVSIAELLRDAAGSSHLMPCGPCSVHGRGGQPVDVDLMLASACRALGRDLVLVRLARRRPDDRFTHQEAPPLPSPHPPVAVAAPLP